MAFSSNDEAIEIEKLERKTDTSDVKAPERIVKTERQVKNIFTKLRDDHLARAKRMAKIRRMLDNHPPFDPEKLRKEGRTEVANTNLGDGKNIFNTVGLNYWSLVNEDKLLVDLKTTMFDSPQNIHVSNVMSEKFSQLLRKWADIETLTQEHQNDYLAYGFSVFHFPDNQDWRPEVIDPMRLFLPKGARVDVSTWSKVAIMHTMTAQDLWNHYMSEKSHGLGWSKEAIGEVLYSLASRGSGADKAETAAQGMLELLREISAGDSSIETIYNDDVLLVSVYVKEWSGKVSRYVIHPSIEAGDILFTKEDVYDSMREAFVAFPYSPGEKYVHNNKGLGHSIYNPVQVSTHIDNHLINSIKRAGAVLVQTTHGGNNDTRQIKFNYDGVVDLGSASFAQNFLGANLPQLVTGAQYIQSKIYNNNDVQSSSMQPANQAKRSATEVQAEMQHKGRVSKSRLAYYLKNLDGLWREIARRVWNCKDGHAGYDEGVSWFKRQLAAAGIPEQIFAESENEGPYGLPEHMEISAVRVSGSGSQAVDGFEMAQIRELMPLFGERGRANVIKHSIRAIRGSSFIDAYYPPEDQAREPTNDHSLAAVENFAFRMGGDEPIVSPDNKHSPHLEVHIPFGMQIMELYKSNKYDLQEADSTLRGLVPHIAEHLAFLQTDNTRKALFDTFLKSFYQLINFADEISGNARKQRERQLKELQMQQQEKQQLDGDTQVALYGEELHHQREVMRLSNEISRQEKGDRAKFALEAAKIRRDGILSRLKAGAELSLKERQMILDDQREQERDNREATIQ